MGTRTMHRAAILGLLLSLASVPAAAQAPADPGSPDSLEARLRVDRGAEPVVEPGDDVRIYYEVSADAWVAIFRVDTGGRVSLLFPQHPEADNLARAGREYRLLLADARTWTVEDDLGEGSFFMIASAEPLDFSLFAFGAERGWDLSGAGAAAYEDPYQAIDDYVLAVLPGWETVPYALDYLPYEVVAEGTLDPDVRSGPSGTTRATWGAGARAVVVAPLNLPPRVRILPRYRRIVRWRPFPGFGAAVRYAPPPARLRAPPPWRARPRPHPVRRYAAPPGTARSPRARPLPLRRARPAPGGRPPAGYRPSPPPRRRVVPRGAPAAPRGQARPAPTRRPRGGPPAAGRGARGGRPVVAPPARGSRRGGPARAGDRTRGARSG